MDEATLDRWRDLYFPYLATRRKMLLDQRGRVVHYTSASVAASIVTNREIWMRNSATMNDFMEVEYGLELLASAYRGACGNAFKNSVDTTFPNMCGEIEELFNSWQPHLRSDTYLTCVSEHESDEDNLGRLSMWRAYGGDAGVALVLKPEVMHVRSDALGVFSFPVLYADQSAFDQELLRIACKLDEEREFVQSLGRDEFRNSLFHMLRGFVLSTKHPGFREEREWRVIYSPKILPSKVMKAGLECVRGAPQRVHKIPLRDFPEHDLHGLELPQLVDRIIIGPSQHPLVIAQAFREMLEIAGFEDPASVVVVSDIPLRQP